ncbi:MAG: 1-phosphofructokinase family hexose kinase [Christensenellales bacterium]
MITTVYLNPCIDKTVDIEKFAYGGMNRVLLSKMSAGGKSVNVALICNRLGMDVRCTGILYSQNGEEIATRLQSEGVGCDFLWRSGSVRVNTKLFDRSSLITTEINETGVPWNEADTQEVIRHIVKNAAGSDYIVLSGSLPPFCPKEFYGDLIDACAKEKCILDAEGEALFFGAQRGPFVIKCNRYELELAWKAKLCNKTELCSAAGRFLAMGAAYVIVTMGKEGLIALGRDGAVYAQAPQVPVVRTVGAGDAVTAGLLCGITRKMDFHDTIRSAAAAAAGAVASNTDTFFDHKIYEDTFGKIVLQEL